LCQSCDRHPDFLRVQSLGGGATGTIPTFQDTKKDGFQKSSHVTGHPCIRSEAGQQFDGGLQGSCGHQSCPLSEAPCNTETQDSQDLEQDFFREMRHIAGLMRQRVEGSERDVREGYQMDMVGTLVFLGDQLLLRSLQDVQQYAKYSFIGMIVLGQLRTAAFVVQEHGQ
jgi:hypothetical protein